MRFVKDLWRLVSYNFMTALLFELLYRLLFFCALVPALAGILRGLMWANGTAYIADVNFMSILSQPASWAFVAIAAMVYAIYVLFEMGALTVLFHASRNVERVTLTQLLRLAWRESVRIVRPRDFCMVFFVIFLSPVINSGSVAQILQDLHLPEYWTEYLEQNTALGIVVMCAIVAVVLLAFLWMFTLHYFVLYHQDFKEAHQRSFALTAHHPWFVAWRLLLWLGISVGVGEAAKGIYDLGLRFIMPAFTTTSAGAAAMFSVSTIAVGIVYLLVQCVEIILAFAWVQQVFYSLCRKLALPQAPSIRVSAIDTHLVARHERQLRRGLGVTIVVAALALGGLATSGMLSSLFSPARCDVTAHRGKVSAAPENTLPAFEAAIDSGAQWVELDVQQTADGVIVVSHDNSTLRLSGQARLISDSTWDEVGGLSVTSFSIDQGRFVTTRYCTLEEALELCRGRVKVNIELKPNGTEENLEQSVVDLVNRLGMHDQVAIASLDYSCLGRVKACDPTMRTIYNMAIAYGDITQLADADVYSVDEAVVTPLLARDVHRAGRQIFAWTVNDSDNIVKMYAYGVDNLVTDNMETALSVVRTSRGAEYAYHILQPDSSPLPQL